MKKQSIKIAYLVNLDLDRVVERHITEVCNQTEVDYTTVSCTRASQPVFTTVKAYPKAKIALIKQKYIFLLHIIITMCKRKEDNLCYLSAKFYSMHIFYKQFTPMIRNLIQMGIIGYGTYEVGEHSTPYYINDWNIDYVITSNINFIKWQKVFDRENKKRLLKYTPSPFTVKYNESLSHFKLTDKEGAIALINETIKPNTHAYHYHMSFVTDFKEMQRGIYSIDNQGRVYHIITSMPKLLRHCYNIKFELDISNSHPLLLTKLLIKYYNINNNIINTINNNINNTHYVRSNLCKLLKDNKMEDCLIDVLEYIYNTQKGVLYDDFCTIIEGMERKEAKTRMFEDVLYSHLEDDNRYTTKFQTAFKKKYPNVWEVIYAAKVKTKDRLPHLMMKMESDMIRPILEECWERGWKVVHLHDAVVVTDCPENESVKSNDVKEIILRHYHQNGLYPNVKAEIGEEA